MKEELLSQIEIKLTNLITEKKVLTQYGLVKLQAGDFHAVADCAMDLRDVTNQMEAYETVKDLIEQYSINAESSAD